MTAAKTAQTVDRDGVPVCEGPDLSPRKPKLKAPAGVIDCHAHIFGPVSRYPFSPRRLFTPPDVTVAQYRALLTTLGIERAVLVTPSVYGMDNERQLDALDELKGAWRGVVVVHTDVRNIMQSAPPTLGAMARKSGQTDIEAHNLAQPGDVLVIEGVAGIRVALLRWSTTRLAPAI